MMPALGSTPAIRLNWASSLPAVIPAIASRESPRIAIFAHCEVPGAGRLLLLRGALLVVDRLGPVSSSGADDAIQVSDEGEAARAASLSDALGVQLRMDIWSACKTPDYATSVEAGTVATYAAESEVSFYLKN